MTASRRLAAIVVALSGLAMAGSAAAENAPGAPACMMVSGGAGAGFSNPAADKFWLDLQREINADVVVEFHRAGYAAHQVFEEVADRAKTPIKAMVAISQSGCAVLLQVTLDNNEDADGKYFAFDVSMLRFVKDSLEARLRAKMAARAASAAAH